MARQGKYPRELRERAVRMVAEVRPDYPREHAAMTAVAGMLGIGSPETIRTWIRRYQVDAGGRPGVTTDAAVEIKKLKRENAELRRANEILKAASAFFAAGHTCDSQIHRRAQGPRRWWAPMGCRVDLRRADSAGCEDCPIDLLRRPRPVAVGSGIVGRAVEAEHPHHLAEAAEDSRRPQTLAEASPRRARYRPLHGRAAYARAGDRRPYPREAEASGPCGSAGDQTC